MSSDNPILYRLRVQRSRLPRWRRWAPTAAFGAACLAAVPLYPEYSETLSLILVTLGFPLYLLGGAVWQAVTLLARERQMGTYETLQTTGFTSGRWVGTLFGTVVSSSLVPLCLWLGSLLLVTRNGQTWFLLALYFLTALPLYVAIGLFLSAGQRTPVRAQLQALSLIVGTFFLSLVADICIARNEPQLCLYVSPWLQAYCSLREMREATLWAELVTVAAHVALTLLLLWATRRRLEQPPVLGGARRVRWLGVGWATHPLVFRASLQAASPSSLLRPLALGVVAWMFPVALLGVTHDRVGPDLHSVSLCLLAVYGCIRAVLAGSVAVAEEREKRSWEALVTLPGKLSNWMRVQWLVGLLPLSGDLLAGGLGLSLTASDGNAVLLATLFLICWIALLYSLAFFISAYSRTSSQALRWSTGVGMAAALTGLAWLKHSPDSTIWMLSPFVGLVQLMEPHRTDLLGAALGIGPGCGSQVGAPNSESNRDLQD